jgi:hypothetical protein
MEDDVTTITLCFALLAAPADLELLEHHATQELLTEGIALGKLGLSLRVQRNAGWEISLRDASTDQPLVVEKLAELPDDPRASVAQIVVLVSGMVRRVGRSSGTAGASMPVEPPAPVESVAPPPPEPAAPPPMDDAAPGRLVLYVLPRDLEPYRADLLEKVLLRSLGSIDGISIVTAADAAAEATSCPDGAMTCLTALARAQGTPWALLADVVVMGETEVLTLKLMNAARAEVTARAVRTVAADPGALAAVDNAVAEIFPGRAAGWSVSQDVQARWSPAPLPRWFFISTAALSAVMGAGGLFFGMLSKDAEEDANAYADQSLYAPIDGQTLVDKQEVARERSMMANALFLGCAVAGVATLFIGTQTDFGGSVDLVDGGASGSVSVRF